MLPPYGKKHYEKYYNQDLRQHIQTFYPPKACPHCNDDSNYLYTCTILCTDSYQPRTDFAYESGSPDQRLCTRLERRCRQLSHLPSDRSCRIAGLLRFRRRAWQNHRANGRISGRLHLHDHDCRNIRRTFSGQTFPNRDRHGAFNRRCLLLRNRMACLPNGDSLHCSVVHRRTPISPRGYRQNNPCGGHRPDSPFPAASPDELSYFPKKEASHLELPF